MNRRKFLAGSTSAAVATALIQESGRAMDLAPGTVQEESEHAAELRNATGHYRFGVNYTQARL